MSAMIAERIRQARLAAGLTLSEVAQRVGELGQPITGAALSKYEHGKSAPRAPLLLKLAQVFNVKASYFLTEPSVQVQWLAFRKSAALGDRRQMQIKATALAVAEHECELRALFYPDTTADLPPQRLIQTFAAAESAAGDLRERWRLGSAPIESVTQTIEDHGAIIFGWAGDEGQFDGLAAWVNETIPMLVVNTAAEPDRRRFSLAHELKHTISQDAHPSSEDEEMLAHRFAGAFLVPAEVARQELGAKRRRLSLDELELLKLKYGLSMAAWAHRARDLNIIEDGVYAQLRAEIRARGSETREHVRCEAPEEPTRLRQMALRAFAEGIITEERAHELCPGAVTASPSTRLPGRLSPRELMRLPHEERARIMAAAAEKAAEVYGKNPELTEFEALDQGDWYDENPD